MCNLRFADLIWLIWFGDFDDIFQIFPNDQSITMGLWGFMFDFLGPQDFHCSPWESLEMVKSHGFQYWKKTIHWFQGITMIQSIQGDLPLWERTIYVCFDVFGMKHPQLPAVSRSGVFIHWNHTQGAKKLSAFGYLQKTIKIAKWTVPPKSHGIANNTLW